MKKLNVIVTGGASGLGLAIVKALAEAGHKPFAYDRKNRLDVNSPDCEFIDRAWPDIDVLINCAGINSNQWFEDLNQNEFDRVMHTNAFSIVKMTQAFFPQLIKSKGTVINIVSNAAHIPMTSSLAYNASKAAALMITRQMAHELTPRHGITVFSVSPNKLAGTEMSKAIEENVCKVRGWTPEYAAAYQKKALMHGLETPPETVAQIIVNLINTGDMKYMSGCDLQIGK